MNWIEETEPFILKPSITRKRIMQGLTPHRRKWLDARKVRKQMIAFCAYTCTDFHGVAPDGIPFYYDENDKQRRFTGGWNRTYIDGKMPHWNGKALHFMTGYSGKSSRERMRQLRGWNSYTPDML